MSTPTTSELNADIYLARIVEKKIAAYNGQMPEYERRTLARNLGELIEQVKEYGFRKGEVVVAANIPHTSKAAAVNALGNYCLLADTKSRRTTRPRLSAYPKNYLLLARAAANLLKIPSHEAIIKLTEGSNAFGVHDEIDQELFSPAEATCDLLRSKLAVIVERHKLKEYFRQAYEVSAAFGEDIFENETTWGQDCFKHPSTSCWPGVYLGTVSRSSVSARLSIEGFDSEFEGCVHTVEQVFLSLGWKQAGWIVGYLEYLPGLAVQSFGCDGHAPSFDLHCAGETFTQGTVGKIRFHINDKASIKVPDGCDGNWPFRLRSRKRFQVITPQVLAETFLGSPIIDTPNQTFCSNIDTSAVLSPPDSLLALIEAELLGRHCPFRRHPNFLEELEKDVVLLTTSFREWRRTQLDAAKNDHLATLHTATQELDALRTVPLSSMQK